MKRVSIMGDSISTFEGLIPEVNRTYYGPLDPNSTGITDPAQTWWMRVINGMGASLLANASFSGSMVEGIAFPAACSDKRAQQLLGDQGEQPDVVFVFIGINDYGWGCADAQMAGGSEAAPPRPENWEIPDELAEDPCGNAPAGSLQQFANAYDEMLENIRSIAPDAEIWCMTLLPGRIREAKQSTFCYQLRGVDIESYNKVIRMAAAANNCNVADIAQAGFDYCTTDGTHPDQQGMEQIAELVLAALEQRPPAPELFSPEMRSERSCNRESGIGCPFAAATGTKWSCVCTAHL